MELSYKSNKLKKCLTKDKKLRKAFGSRAKKVKQRINQLKAADDLWTISKMPQLYLHPHKGRNKGLWSIDVKNNWRMLFSINHNPIPVKDDGGVDLKKVFQIRIEEIVDPH